MEERLIEQLAELVGDDGLELLAVETVGRGPKMIVRLVIDGPDGVSVDDCASVSRQASALLDVEDPIGHAYTLEVTSPGLDRKLYSAADYERFRGERVKVRMKPSHRNHRVVVGELIGLEREAVRIRLDSSDVAELPLDEVFEARLEVDWDAIMREGKS